MLNTHFLRTYGIPALRSGNYTQATGTLCPDPVYAPTSLCALGVLAQAAHDAGLITVDWHLSPSDRDCIYDDLATLAGWDNWAGPQITVGPDTCTIMNANDNETPLAQIADALEHLCDQQDAVTTAESLVTRDPVAV